MRNFPALAQIEQRLAELGCAEKLARRKIRELAEHHEDLKQDAREEGLSEPDAESRANTLLGEPAGLAERLAAALRRSSWWGRHPLLGFCVLPPFVILLLLAGGLWLELTVGKALLTPEQFSKMADGGTGLDFIRECFAGTYFAAIALTAILFCTLARRTVRGMKWGWIACGMCALHGVFFYVSITPHTLAVGYGSHLNWAGMGIPLGIALVAWARLRHAASQVRRMEFGMQNE